jgi:hypothetical protein
MRRLTGLFLGAGASVEAGMPLVWDLTVEIKNWLTPDKLRELNRGWRLQNTGCCDNVIEDLASVLEREDLHYEAILGHLETQFRRQRTAPQEYHQLYSWLVELVSVLLLYRQVNNDAFFGRQLPLYDGIRALAQESAPLWIFSLNHDAIVEAIAARLGLALYCGYGPTTVALPRRDAAGKKIGDIRAEVLTEHDLEKGSMHFPNPPQPGIYLLKVHGSLDTFTFNDGKDVLRLLPASGSVKDVFEVLRAANSDLFYPLPGAPGGRVKTLNEISYADDKGVMQFLRRSLLAGAYKFDARANQVLPKSMIKHFRLNLNSVSTLICIGYSFNDVHINATLREWLEFMPERQLEIVNPGARSIPASLTHLAPQITLTASSCTDYLDARAGIKRSASETLGKRVGAISRTLGLRRSQAAMKSFIASENERWQKDFLARLETIRKKDGKPDFESLGDPVQVARQWASEMRTGRDGALARLARHLESEGDKEGAHGSA